MTIERAEAGAVELQVQEAEPSPRLVRFAENARAAYEVAKQLAPTPFVPTSYKRDKNGWYSPERIAQNAAAAMLAGEEIGLSPMQALQAIDIIEGRPALNALSMRALVQSHGHEVWVHDRTGDAPGNRASVFVTVRGQRAGSEHVAEATWSLDRARQAGLLGKQNWQNHPEPMCLARATSEVCRQIAADVLMGLAYSAEELDGGDVMDAGGHTVEVRPETQPEQTAIPAQREPDDRPPVAPPVEEAQQEPEQVQAEEEPICGQPKPDDMTRVCSRPFEHEGRHHFGRVVEPRIQDPDNEPVEAELVDPETSEPALAEGIQDPEAPGRCSAEHPQYGRCTLYEGHAGQHVPESPPEAPEQPTEPVVEDPPATEPFPEPSEEDLARAFEEEQAAKQQASPPAPAAADEDDPWKDFE